MSWSEAMEASMRQDMAALRTQFLTGWSRINQLVYPASVEPDNNSPSRQEITNIKSQLERIPGQAHDLVNRVSVVINNIVKATDEVSDKVHIHKKEVDDLKEEVTNAESIASVRKEQAEAPRNCCLRCETVG